MNRDVALWTGVLASPIVWLIQFEANFALAPWACVTQAKLTLYLVTTASLLLAAGSGLIAWQQWKQLGKEWPGQAGGALARQRIMAIGGVLLSATFFLVILAQLVPELMLGACE